MDELDGVCECPYERTDGGWYVGYACIACGRSYVGDEVRSGSFTCSVLVALSVYLRHLRCGDELTPAVDSRSPGRPDTR